MGKNSDMKLLVGKVYYLKKYQHEEISFRFVDFGKGLWNIKVIFLLQKCSKEATQINPGVSSRNGKRR